MTSGHASRRIVLSCLLVAGTLIGGGAAFAQGGPGQPQGCTPEMQRDGRCRPSGDATRPGRPGQAPQARGQAGQPGPLGRPSQRIQDQQGVPPHGRPQQPDHRAGPPQQMQPSHAPGLQMQGRPHPGPQSAQERGPGQRPGRGLGPRVGDPAGLARPIDPWQARRLPPAPPHQHYREMDGRVVRFDDDTMKIIAIIGLTADLLNNN